MNRSFQLKAALFFVCAFMFSSGVMAQMGGNKPIASPRDSVSGMIHGATITINYGSPSVKGRKIWGGLVPYDTVWRAGANEATTFTTSKQIKVQAKCCLRVNMAFLLSPVQKSGQLFLTVSPTNGVPLNMIATKIFYA